MLKFKKWFRWAWIVIVLSGLVYYLVYPELFSPTALAQFVSRNEEASILLYIILSCTRGIFLLPSTPFVLAGVILFPDQTFLVITISMFGIMFTSFLLYSFAENLGFRKYLIEKHPDKMKVWEQRLTKPFAFWIILGWSFFPFVPTDLICYVAGTVKMKKYYYYSGIFLGEVVLVSFYVFVGKDIWQFLTF